MSETTYGPEPLATYCPLTPGRPCERRCVFTCLADVEAKAVGGGSRTAESTRVARVGEWSAEQLAEARRRLAEPIDGYQSGYAYVRARYGKSTRREAEELFLELNGVLDQPQGLSVPGRARADDRWANRPLTGRGDFPRREGDFLVLGPEVFANQSRRVLNWSGVNYVPQADVEPLLAALRGIDRVIGNEETVGAEQLGEVRGLVLDALRQWHTEPDHEPRTVRAGQIEFYDTALHPHGLGSIELVGEPGERPDDAHPGVALDGQGLPPAADTPGGTA